MVRAPQAQVLRRADPRNPSRRAIAIAAQAVRDGLLVAFPTETVYGLGAAALNEQAVEGIFRAKGRPADNPLIVHIAEPEELRTLVDQVPREAWDLARKFWPGPLTLVLEHNGQVPPVTTGGLPTVAVRLPAHPIARALIKAAGTPIAAPSANRSGSPSPTRAQHVIDDLGDQVAVVLDGGPCAIGLESTVLDLTVHPPVLLRPGAVSGDDLREVLGHVTTPTPGDGASHRSPGTRHRHYAPEAKVVIVHQQEVEREARRWAALGYKVGTMSRGPSPGLGRRHKHEEMPADSKDYARHLFLTLRRLDAVGCDVIVVEGIEEQGIGVAIMDRLRRAMAATTVAGEAQ